MDVVHAARNTPGKPSARLSIRLLGTFDVLDSIGCPITIRSRKARLLLVYLAAHPGKRLNREQLATLLWSDRGDRQARASLRQALLTLRTALGDAGFIDGDSAGIALSARKASRSISPPSKRLRRARIISC